MTTIVEKYNLKKNTLEITVHARKYSGMLGIEKPEPDPEGDAETARVLREKELATQYKKEESNAIAVRNSMRCVIL